MRKMLEHNLISLGFGQVPQALFSFLLLINFRVLPMIGGTFEVPAYWDVLGLM